jgi:hypothetical protein
MIPQATILFGIFSLVVVMGKILYPYNIPLRQAEWYEKDEAAFSDILGIRKK